jgi:hypothetical protein
LFFDDFLSVGNYLIEIHRLNTFLVQ